MRLPWLERRDDPAWQRLLLLPLSGLGLVYGLVAAMHRGLYRRGWWRARRLPCRVVSVGGISSGGSGKTPLAAWVARELRAQGYCVAIASRGYGREGTDRVVVVSDGRHVQSTPAEAGDEPFLLASLAAEVPVIVARDRGVAGLRAVSVFNADVVVLDDGFHHHRLARDIEIVALDGGIGLGNGCVLPRGPLRERPSSLRLADVIVVIDGPLDAADEAVLRRLAPNAQRFEARRAPVSWRPLAGGAASPASSLAGHRVGHLAGVARPASFRRTVEGLGARVVAERFFRDHHRYRPEDLQDLEPGVSTWLTTEKDAVKMVAAWAQGADIRVLSIALEVAGGERLSDWLGFRLRDRHPKR